jgi:hypothetical protein
VRPPRATCVSPDAIITFPFSCPVAALATRPIGAIALTPSAICLAVLTFSDCSYKKMIDQKIAQIKSTCGIR